MPMLSTSLLPPPTIYLPALLHPSPFSPLFSLFFSPVYVPPQPSPSATSLSLSCQAGQADRVGRKNVTTPHSVFLQKHSVAARTTGLSGAGGSHGANNQYACRYLVGATSRRCGDEQHTPHPALLLPPTYLPSPIYLPANLTDNMSLLSCCCADGTGAWRWMRSLARRPPYRHYIDIARDDSKPWRQGFGLAGRDGGAALKGGRERG